MKTYLNKDINEINTALLQSVGTNKVVVHETSTGNIIHMCGLRTSNDDFYSKEKNTKKLTLIGPDDKIYTEDLV